MNTETFTNEFLNEAIKIELKMHELYTLFQESIHEDSDFWKKLAAEEISHAQTIRKMQPFLKFDPDLIAGIGSVGLKALKDENSRMQEKIDNFKQNSSRTLAFEIAIEIENSASEIHYQTYLTHESDSKVSHIFQILNGNDKDHADRITNYMYKVKKD